MQHESEIVASCTLNVIPKLEQQLEIGISSRPNIKVIPAGIYQNSSASNSYTKFDISVVEGSKIKFSGKNKKPSAKKSYSYDDFNDKPDDNDKGGEAIHISQESKAQKSYFELNNILNHYLSWINYLPQWLQNQVLNSTPIKTLIESIKLDSAIYKPKSIAEDFYYKVIYIEDIDNSMKIIENDIVQKARASSWDDTSSAIDMAMKLTITAGSMILILPTMIEYGSDILGKNSAFNVNFDTLLHGSEIL